VTPGFARHWGQGTDPALLLHCSLAHAGAWDGVARALSDRLQMVAPDMVGHGKAVDHDPAQDFHDQSTAEAARHMPPAPCHLIGHSFGATVALRLGLEHPSRVRSLTLIEPVLFAAAGKSKGRAANRAALAQVASVLETDDRDAAARAFMGVWGGSTPYEDLPDSQKRYMRARIPLIVASDPALEQDAAGLVPRLGDVTCPVLLIQGGASPAVIDEIQSKLAAKLPNSDRVTINGAGHMAPISHPMETAQAIRAFLDR